MTTIAKDSVGDRLDLKGGELTAVIDTQEVLLGGDVILEIDGRKSTAIEKPAKVFSRESLMRTQLLR